MSTTEKELRDAARAAEAFLSDEERRERDAQGEALDRAIAQHEKARGDLEASIRRDAHARGLEEALECCAEMLPEHEVERMRDIFRARAEAVRKGET